MNKQDLIVRIVKDTGATKTQASRIVAVFLATVTKALKKGEAVTFVGFGTFKTSLRKAHTGRNPLTGGTIRIPKRKAVRFSAGKALKKAVN
ncbi:MAG: HU family DNA-binding protein [Acidobacteria bacterium]|nr:HU family DNA-binding protein [Acidobacteriota bacterium]MSO61427.1 HU family DNA-binding protein [Acidobacteriota bacterium]